MTARAIVNVEPERGVIKKCPGCDAILAAGEIAACWQAGLKNPVCTCCLAGALVFVRDELLPLLRALEKAVADLAEKVPYERLEQASQVSKRQHKRLGKKWREIVDAQKEGVRT